MAVKAIKIPFKAVQNWIYVVNRKKYVKRMSIVNYGPRPAAPLTNSLFQKFGVTPNEVEETLESGDYQGPML